MELMEPKHSISGIQVSVPGEEDRDVEGEIEEKTGADR